MKKKIFGAAVLVVLMCALVFVYRYTKTQQVTDGLKNVTITIENANGQKTAHDVQTDKSYLKDAMDEAKINYETNDGMVMSVEGQRADYVLDGAYWCFYVNGEMCNYGIADQPVCDGDSFDIVYTRAQ